MVNFMTTCYFPCLCEDCRAVVEVNLFDQPARCPTCKSEVVPYDDPTLSELPGEQTIASWNMDYELGRELELTDGTYRCPRCGQMTLQFMNTGLLWD
jgi:Zn finger protein HypA/HybF involved in hydrogenase expression